jgi:nucleoside 2-deoxyribosyltransferase
MSNDNHIFAFVLMPFDKKFDDIYKLGIKETASQLDIVAERVDEQIFQEGILERIYRQIESADLIIADMSGQNPNVFYEVGYAHAKEKLCVLITKNADDIPFDLKHHRHIVYGDSIQNLRDNLSEELAWAKNEITNIRTSKIKVILKNTDGNLEKTKYRAKGTVDFKIDLLNESAQSSPDIEAIYFYCGKGWSLYQDGNECPTTDSDLTGFSSRHFLTPPLRKLHKNSWAQLKFRSEKTLGWALDGDELKDSYRLTGRSIIRLVTSEGNFDYEISLDVEVNEIPF